MGRSIYVAIKIRSSIEAVWDNTQDPAQHQRWDLRFTRIDYLPRENPAAPQRFEYATRIGLGLEIRGWGESVGKAEDGGCRTSALRFGSDDPRSLITQGSGYWQYRQEGALVDFRTRYQYDTRFGRVGKAVDRLFRPLMAWATAWSFDSLRQWLETGTPPETQRRSAVVHATSRIVLAFVWIYHGLVPKILFSNTGELQLLEATNLFRGAEATVLPIIGLLEITLGIATLVLWRSGRLLTFQAWLVAVLTLGGVYKTRERIQRSIADLRLLAIPRGGANPKNTPPVQIAVCNSTA